MKGITRYSQTIPGSRRNYGWSVRYDLTDGSLGITQFERGVVAGVRDGATFGHGAAGWGEDGGDGDTMTQQGQLFTPGSANRETV